MLYVSSSLLLRTADPFHLLLMVATGATVALAAAGAGVTTGLLVLARAPIVTLVGYETIGHRHMATALERL